MKVHEVMTKHVECVAPTTSLEEAARMMRDHDIGPLPICDNDRLVGMVTDRDIAVRAVAEGRDPRETSVGDIMTEGVKWCLEDDDIHDALQLMEEQQIRRLAVLDRDKRLVGIVSLGDLAVKTREEEEVGEALERISEPARPR